jgi:hypothetical protein
MKPIRIFALITTLALGFALRSAQARTQDITSLYSTQSTKQTTTTTMSDDSVTVQQDQTTISITDPFSSLDPNSYSGESTNDRDSKFYDQESNRVQDIANGSGAN